jgi:hypothetical protein
VKKGLILILLLAVAVAVGFWRKSDNSFSANDKNLEIIKLKFFENYNLPENSLLNLPESERQISLFEKTFTDQEGAEKKVYFATDYTQNQDFFKKNSKEVNASIKNLHTNPFWDPKRCSQMIHVIGSDEIIFSDSFVEQGDMTSFLTFVYVFNLKDNTLTSYKVPISIQKMFFDGQNFFAISQNKKDNFWRLYSFDFQTNKLILRKVYTSALNKAENRLDPTENNLGLITATSTLVWCDLLNSACSYDTTFNFIKEDDNLDEITSFTNPFELSLIYQNNKILEFTKDDNLRTYVVGLKPN